MKIYTGIGSRKTPDDILVKMKEIGYFLANKGWTLRSGGADGADSAFEAGCDAAKGKKEIYLPWKSFNGSQSDLYDIPNAAFEKAWEIHPNWLVLKRGAKSLHARNIQQILGKDLDTPTDMIVCWTGGGKLVGGTRTALVLGQSLTIPIINLAIVCEAINHQKLKR